MQPLKNIAVLKSAVAICLHPELKREILCARGSEYDANKSSYQYCRKLQWNAIIERKGMEILRQMLPSDLAEKVVVFLPAIGLRMLIWAEYHEGTLGLTREYSVGFLRGCHFTERGSIDNAKAAEDLFEAGKLSARQKYKLACLYCFADQIAPLFKEVVGNAKDFAYDAGDAKWFEKPSIVKFWTSEQTERNRSNASKDYALFQHAIKSGCKSAVVYSLNMAKKHYTPCIAQAAASVVRNQKRSLDSDWIIFRDRRYDDAVDDPWVPTEYSNRVIWYLFSTLVDLQGQGVLKRNILTSFFRLSTYSSDHSSVLDLSLYWPHQDNFMKTATVMWDFMTGRTYVTLLLKICDEIEPRKCKNILYGEEKCYEYLRLLRNFWCQSPDDFKRYVFKDRDDYFTPMFRYTRPGHYLLSKLLSLAKFTHEAEETVLSILDASNAEEKLELMSEGHWSYVLVNRVLKNERFEVFDRFFRVCFQTEAEADEFKEKLELEKDAECLCTHFVRHMKLDAVESVIKRIPLSDSEIERLLEDVIYSSVGKQQCLKLLSSGKSRAFKNFVEWFLPSEEKVRAFKRMLKFEYVELSDVAHFQQDKILELADHFKKSNCPPENAIQQLKESVNHVFGLTLCEDLILGLSIYAFNNGGNSTVCKKSGFKSVHWEKIDKFLSSLLPEKKIVAFKKSIFQHYGIRVLFNLIESEQWSQAEEFCEWLGLPEQKIKELKWDTFFCGKHGMWDSFRYLMFSETETNKKLEKIDAMFRRHFTKQENVIRFRDKFLSDCDESFDAASLHILYLSVERYLDELDPERVQECVHSSVSLNLHTAGIKRPSSTSSLSKKAHLSQPRKNNMKQN